MKALCLIIFASSCFGAAGAVVDLRLGATIAGLGLCLAAGAATIELADFLERNRP